MPRATSFLLPADRRKRRRRAKNLGKEQEES
jgi:hypothetical protein